MFKWAKQPGRKFVTVNPFADLPAPRGTITPRDRFLSADELRQLDRALDDPASLGIKPDAATALRLILVTTARPGTTTVNDARGRVISRESTSGNATTIYDDRGRNVGRFTTNR